MPFDKFCERLAYYKAEINMLHPFRDGNGRTIREFIRRLAKYNGYELNFNIFDKEKYMQVMFQSPYDTKPLENFLKKCILESKVNIKAKVIEQYKNEFPDL